MKNMAFFDGLIPVHSYRYFNFWYLVDTTSTVYCHYSYDGLENKPAMGTKMQKHIAELEVDRSADSKTTQGLTAYAGNQSCPVKFSRPMLPGKSGLAKVSRRVAACLKIPAGSYRIYHFDRHSLYLGPVVGIFSSAIKPGGCPGRSETKINKEMKRNARQRGIINKMFEASSVDNTNRLHEQVPKEADD